MHNIDFAIYAVHLAAWGAFGLTLLYLGRKGETTATADAPALQAQQAATAPWSRALVMLHMIAFGVMYFGIANAVIPNRVPILFPLQRLAGALVIAAGAALMVWALVWFRSWRFRAKLDSGHQLATGGPFRFMRHPIYGGLNLLALGSALWVPTPILWVALALMILGGDLRGRAEEKVLTTAFGDEYRNYCARTKRFIPGIY